MAEVGFLPVSDPRIAGTVAAVEQDLLRHGFVDRYAPRVELTVSLEARVHSCYALSG